MLRPRPTTWFELLTGRDQFALAMQTLAASGAAELEAKLRPAPMPDPALDASWEAEQPVRRLEAPGRPAQWRRRNR